MTRIHVLDQQTANSIAAGEVVERPSSVIKELVENALDAGASVITAEIRQGGIRLIRVIDNGGGMDAEDALMAFGRHATSKLRQIEDLDSILTMGFRGEALASIAAVSQVTLETRQPGKHEGSRIRIAGGGLLENVAVGCAEGTSMLVENLFFNIPARFKFLKKDATEAGLIIDLMQRFSLARPDVSFRLVNNGQNILHTPGNNDLMSTIYAVYGKQTAQACLTIQAQAAPLRLSGAIARPEQTRNTRDQQSFFVNGRLIRSKVMTAALDEAYKTFLMKNKYAIAVLFIELPPHLVDVNVHPQKMEVRFWNDQDVFRSVYHTVHDALIKSAGVTLPEGTEPGQLTDLDPDLAADNAANAPGSGSEGTDEGPAADSDNRQHVEYEQPGLDGFEKSVILGLNDRLSADNLSAVGNAEAEHDGRAGDGPGQFVLKVNELSRARWIGQAFQTYLLFELDGEILWIDQHAAHEKILFERLIDRYRRSMIQTSLDDEDGSLRQDLLVPVILELSSSDMAFLQHEQELLRQLGFTCTIIGSTAVVLRSLPDTGGIDLLPEAAFRQVLSSLQQDDPRSDDGISEAYYSMACKAAVKAHDRLDEREVKQLLHDLQQLEQPYMCPHGRPVIVRMTRHELEKRFKRIV